MTHPYIEKSERWTMALRKLMGYPVYAPPFHTTAWCSSGPRDVFQIMEMTRLATDMRRDIVHVAFELDADEPVGIGMAVRRDIGIDWLTNVRPYAGSETAKLELLASDRRWYIGPRHVLTGAKLPPKDRRAKGEEIALRRWRQAAATMKPLALEGSLWVPAGGRYADAIPHEALCVAA